MEEKSIYIILSQTGTMFSKALKVFTGAEYNHFIGGFVQEWKNIGAFKLFQKKSKGVGHKDQYQSI